MVIYIIQNMLSELTNLKYCVDTCYPGSQINCFTDYASAVDAIKNENKDIDICFTSFNGEKISGIEIVKSLRSKNARTKIVFVEDSDRYAMDAWQLNANDYIIKPVTLENVMHTVESCGQK